MKVDEPDKPPPSQSSRPLDPPSVTAGPLGKLKQTLHSLYIEAGGPSYDRIVWLISKDDSLPGAPLRDTVQKIMRADGFVGKNEDVVAIGTVLAREGRLQVVPDLVHGLWVQARQFAPIGQLISEVSDPLAFGVHRAIDVPPTARSVSPGRLVLPVYVERAHDRVLGEAIARVTAGGSEIVTLVGGSSTGKTRACWEALQRFPEGWRVWHPLRPDRPEALLQGLSRVGPRTVVWLNDAQHYLQPVRDRIGEQVAAELRELLRSPSGGPLLVLATLWPGHWDDLTKKHDPSTDVDQVHAQARELLVGTYLNVPGAFGDPDLKMLLERAHGDAHLRQAVEHAEQGQITQYLAGGPALIERYETASPAERALIEAAMDARRLGHGLALPLAFLEAAVPGYLTDLEWDVLQEDWLERALTYVTRPCQGARGPLTLIRARPGEPDDRCPQYRFADYLEQHGRDRRRRARVPGSFWEAARIHVHGDSRRVLGSAAHARGLLRMAFHLYAGASPADIGVALTSAGGMLRDAGRIQDALTCYQRAAEAGNIDALWGAVGMLREAGRPEETIPWYQRAAEAGNTNALWVAVGMLQKAGRIEEAIIWLQTRAEGGDTDALQLAAGMLQKAGRIEEAIIWLQTRAEGGDTDALQLAAGILEKAGRIEEAITRFQRAAAAGHVSALGSGARMLQKEGRTEEAILWYQQAAEAGDIEALNSAVWMLQDASRTEEATTLLQARAETGDTAALQLAVGMLQKAGRIEEAITWLQARAEAGDTSALQLTVKLLREAGRIEEALTWSQRAAKSGDISALRLAVGMLQMAGRAEEALTWSQRAAESGDISALRSAVGMLQMAGRLEEAITWTQRIAESGDTRALQLAAWMLQKAGRLEEALSWLQIRAGVGQTDALSSAALMLQEAGRIDEAITWFQRAAEAGNLFILRTAARMLQLAGRTEEAIPWYQRAAEAGDTDSLSSVVGLLEMQGRTEEALTWLQARAEAGDIDRVSFPAAWLLQKQGRYEEAIPWYQRAAETGDTNALGGAVQMLQKAGRTDEAYRLQRNGWESDGSIATSWEAWVPEEGHQGRSKS